MLRIDVPANAQPLSFATGMLAPHLAPAAQAYTAAVYARSKLPLRIFEAARLRIAQINGCELCQAWRSHLDVPEMLARYGVSDAESNALQTTDLPDEELYAAVSDWRDTCVLDAREKMAVEYADRFARAPGSMDDLFWEDAHTHFTDAEIVDLTLCLGAFIASGRFAAVLGLGDSCQLPRFAASASSAD